MSVSRLQVTYKSPEIDVELDKKIENFFESIGFRRWASGYDLLSFERDIAFERRTEEEDSKRPEYHEEMEVNASKRNQKVKLTA